MFKHLNPILHAPLRLAVVSLLLEANYLDFKHIQKETDSTAGNLSVQLRKLEEAGYVEIEKRFKNNYPQTRCKLTTKGCTAFAEYVENLEKYIGKKMT